MAIDPHGIDVSIQVLKLKQMPTFSVNVYIRVVLVALIIKRKKEKEVLG